MKLTFHLLLFAVLLIKCASGALCAFTYGNWFQPAASGGYVSCQQICASQTNPLNGFPGSFATPHSTDISGGLASILAICANANPYTPTVWIAGTFSTIVIVPIFNTLTLCQYIVKSLAPPFGTASGFQACSSVQQCLCGWPSSTTLTSTTTTTTTVTSPTLFVTTTVSLTVTTSATLTFSSVSLIIKTIVVLSTQVFASTSRTTRTITSSTLVTFSETMIASTTTTLEDISTFLYTTTLSTLILTTISSETTTTSILVTCPSSQI